MTETNDGDEHWKEAERVAAIFEKTLTPSADVRVNQWLPDIITGDLRQCDVVVRAKVGPRPFLTIVEVQDRGRKPNIGTYEGWVSKKGAVGAHMLVCVSKQGFPDSIREAQRKKNPNDVRLVTHE